jgi:hypothetical protein
MKNGNIKEQFKEGSKNAKSHDIEGDPHYKSNETTLMKIQQDKL